MAWPAHYRSCSAGYCESAILDGTPVRRDRTSSPQAAEMRAATDRVQSVRGRSARSALWARTTPSARVVGGAQNGCFCRCRRGSGSRRWLSPSRCRAQALTRLQARLLQTRPDRRGVICQPGTPGFMPAAECRPGIRGRRRGRPARRPRCPRSPLRPVGPVPARAHHRRQPARPAAAPRECRGHGRRFLPHAPSPGQRRNHLEQDLIKPRGGDFYLATSWDKNLAVDSLSASAR
jgi:hypothetical protein